MSRIAGRNSGGGIDVARCALHGLDEHGGDGVGGGVLDGLAREVGAGHAAARVLEADRAAVAVGVRREKSPSRERTPAVLALVAHQAHHARGLAVEAAPEADDLVLLGVRLGEADGRLDRLRAARVELRAVELAGRHRRELLEKRQAILGREAADGDPCGSALPCARPSGDASGRGSPPPRRRRSRRSGCRRHLRPSHRGPR